MKKKDVHETLVAILRETFKPIKGTKGVSFDYFGGGGYEEGSCVHLYARFRFGEFSVEQMEKDVAKLCDRVKACAVGSVTLDPHVFPIDPCDDGDLCVMIWFYFRRAAKK